MADFATGFLATQQANVVARNDITVAIRNIFPNLNPFLTRLPFVPVDSVAFQLTNYKYRPQTTTLGAAIAANNTTALTFGGNIRFLMNHDVLELVDSTTGNSERVQVNGDPTGDTTANVIRGVSGTTPLAAVANGSTVYLIGSSRTGSEVDQNGIVPLPTSRLQYCQTFQHPIQVGGSAQTTRAAVLPAGLTTPFDFQAHIALQNFANDIEDTLVYGIAEAPVDSTGVTAKMAGIRALLTTNNTTNPTNKAAYTLADFIRDTLGKARSGGGAPDVVFISSEFMAGLTTWGAMPMRVDAGATELGTPIETISAPFVGNVTLIESPRLRPYTAIALTSSEVYIRNKRNPYLNNRGNRGDMIEGEWIGELSIEVVNEPHHAFVEGITGFSAT